MENPVLVLQETGSRPTYSRLNYVPSGDTLRRDAISSLHSGTELIPLFPYLRTGLQRGGGRGLDGGIAPGNRLLATDHGLTGFPDLKVNPGLGL